MKVILISFFLFGLAYSANLTCECGQRNAGRIVGGIETKKNEYPWMVGIVNNTNNFAYCGGTVLTRRHIITAAHCVNTPNLDIYLVVGTHDINDQSDSNRQRLTIEQVILHPDPVSDLALIVTEADIQFNDVVSRVCMPDFLTGDELNYATVKALGWGRYDPRRPNMDKIKKLREVDLHVTTPDRCNGVNITRLCTFTPGKDTCNGDSGGPVVWLDPEINRFTLVGVVSSGPTDCGNSPDPGVNIYVLHYLFWINEMIWRTVHDAWTCYKA